MTKHFDLPQRWAELSQRINVDFRPAIDQILQEDIPGFQVLWMLSDFAEICVKHCSLVLLARLFHDAGLRKLVTNGSLEHLLNRPTFGTWLGFIERTTRQLQRADSSGANQSFAKIIRSCGEDVEFILNRRNTLAHGTRKRYEVAKEDVDRLSARTLAVAEKVAPILAAALHFTDRHVHCDTSMLGWPGITPLYPFMLSGPKHQLHRYASVERHTVRFTSTSDSHDYPDLKTVITQFLRGPSDSIDSDDKDNEHVRHQCDDLVSNFRTQVDDSYLGREWLLRELPRHAGRPTLFEHLRTTLASEQEPLVIHLFGRRGLGKRRWLAEFMQCLRKDGHVTIPLRSWELEDRDLLTVWSTKVGLDGKLDALADASGTARSILTLDGLSELVASPNRSREMAKLMEAHSRMQGIHFVFLSDDSVPLSHEWTRHPGFVQIAFPPMETEACAEFYGRIGAKSGDAPLSSWQSLPPDAKRAAGVPVDLVRMCRRYRHRHVPHDFALHTEFAESWDSDMAELWQTHVMARPDAKLLVAERATEIVHACLPGHESIPAFDCHNTSTYESLASVGILTHMSLSREEAPRSRRQFTTYYYLVRALQLVAPLDKTESTMTDDELSTAFAYSNHFPPFGDALTLSLAASPTQLPSALNMLLVAHPPAMSRLVEGLLIRAYPYPELFEELVSQILHTADADALMGCGAAAQQLVAGDDEARAEGTQLYSRLIETSRTAGLGALHAQLLNEFGLFGITRDAPQKQLAYFDLAHRLAQANGLHGLACVARNNAASVMLDQAELHAAADPRVAQEQGRYIRELLANHELTPRSPETWRQVRTALLHLSRAQALAAEDEQDGEYLRQVIEICQQYGSSTDLAHANTAYASFLGATGQARQAHRFHAEAIRWMLMSGDPIGLGQCHFDQGCTHLAQADAIQSKKKRREQLDSGVGSFRQALHDVETAPEDVNKWRLLGQVWSQLGATFHQLRLEEDAVKCEQKSIYYLRRAGLLR